MSAEGIEGVVVQQPPFFSTWSTITHWPSTLGRFRAPEDSSLYLALGARVVAYEAATARHVSTTKHNCYNGVWSSGQSFRIQLHGEPTGAGTSKGPSPAAQCQDQPRMREAQALFSRVSRMQLGNDVERRVECQDIQFNTTKVLFGNLSLQGVCAWAS